MNFKEDGFQELMKKEASKKMLVEQYETLKNYDDDKEEQLIALREREQVLEEKRQNELRNNHIKLEVAERKKQNKIKMDKKNGEIDVALNAEKDLVLADEVHFTNLVNNLLDNAVKYSRDDLRIKISSQTEGNRLKVKIEDNGIGMSNETVNRIFEKFYRAHTGNLHNVKGFGLGLNYVKTMVDAHHGNIKVESILGKGSSFLLSFPLASI